MQLRRRDEREPEPGCVPGARLGGTGHASSDGNGGPRPRRSKYNLPPVFPVVNAIIGVQIKPTDKIVINIEGGIRTLPFFGISRRLLLLRRA